MLKKILFIMLLNFAFLGCFSQDSVELGKKAPEISAKMLNGDKAVLPSDKIAVLVFFENSCPACVKELPLLNELVREQSANLSVVAINSVDEMPILQVIKDKYALYDIILARDDLNLSWQRYGILALPTSFVIKDGVILGRFVGDKWDELHSLLVSLF